MATYRCDCCGCVEQLLHVPDCCSLCRANIAPRDDLGLSIEQLDAAHFAAMETAYRGEGAIEESLRVPPLAAGALGLALACFIAVSLMPSGFEACIERHSAATCHNTLFR